MKTIAAIIVGVGIITSSIAIAQQRVYTYKCVKCGQLVQTTSTVPPKCSVDGSGTVSVR